MANLDNCSSEIPALIVPQWMDEWNEVKWDSERNQAEPSKKHFYLFTLPARRLRELAGVYRRRAVQGIPRAQDLRSQRYHDQKRSDEISEFKTYGFPWSDLPPARRNADDFSDLRKPGWLPTSIVVNILLPGDERDGVSIRAGDVIAIKDGEAGMASLRLPEQEVLESSLIPPIEIIDGQHRLWAFDESEPSDFSLPVVAFHGLDRSWQAYLFWTINIKPKRINASLAYDLYPLLRSEDWLEKFYGHSIYRETRAQELVEALWSHPLSPWKDRINMLGEPGMRGVMVSQAAWVRSLMASFIKTWDGPRGLGGLFGAPVGSHELVLPWSRHQQAAFLIFCWQLVRNSIAESYDEWATSLRRLELERGRAQKSLPGIADETNSATNEDPAFSGPYSLLATDQGVRGVLHVMNDLVYLNADSLGLLGLADTAVMAATDEQAVSKAVEVFWQQPRLKDHVGRLARYMTRFDWRTSSTPGLTRDERWRQSAYRGSGGYLLLRRGLLELLVSDESPIGDSARKIQLSLGSL